MLLRALLSVSLIAAAANAQPRPHNLVPTPVRSGPWDNDLVIATSKDGLTFEKGTTFVERGGVPHIAADAKGRLIAIFQWFPFDKPEAFDKVGVRISDDNAKTWSDPKPIVVKNLPEGYARPFDPTLVLLEDGRLRLYFTCHRPDRRTPAIYSAVGTDGVEYEFEPGMRLALDGEMVIDCACARLGKTFHLYSPIQEAPGKAYHAVSEDGLTFRRIDDVAIANDTQRERNWLGCALSTADGIRFYGTGRGMWSAVSKNGETWQVDQQTRGEGADPGVARAADGTYILIATGRRRVDARTAKPPR